MSEFGRYSEKAWWLCQRDDNAPSIIGGPLAEILKPHSDFKLTFIAHNAKRLKAWHTRRHKRLQACGLCSDIELALSCDHLLQHCGEQFPPEKITRLSADAAGVSKGYRYQDLMVGVCPVCGKDALGYIGINGDEDPIRYERISEKKYQDWIYRQAQAVRKNPVKLKPGAHSRKTVNVVTGSVIEKNSGKYRYSDAIGVQ